MRLRILLIIVMLSAVAYGGRNIFSSSFDKKIEQRAEGAILSDVDTCELCDFGSANLNKVKKPVKIVSGKTMDNSLLFNMDNTDSIILSLNADSTKPHRIRFFYKANITKDTGGEGGYISFSYGDTGGVCELGFVVNNAGIALSRTPSGEVDYWNVTVQHGEWNEVTLDTGPCQEAQQHALFLISVTSAPDNWGSIAVDDISVDETD